MHNCTESQVIENRYCISANICPLSILSFARFYHSCYQHYLVKIGLITSVNFPGWPLGDNGVHPGVCGPGLARSAHGQASPAVWPHSRAMASVLTTTRSSPPLSSHDRRKKHLLSAKAGPLGARLRTDQILNLPGIRFTAPVITFFSLDPILVT